MRAVKETANAKINLYLDVIARRDDGFHDIKTVMHSISLADTVTVVYEPSRETDIKLYISGNKFLPTDGRNLAVKAAQLFLARAGNTGAVKITLTKSIPIAAGLAGGSSDAAAVLRAMNRLFGKMFTDRALSLMGAELGSDIPYCLIGGTALCEGRGEIITRLPSDIRLYTVVAVADERMSTPVAYSALDGMYSDFDGSRKTGGDAHYARLIEEISRGELDGGGLFNIFEEAVLPLCPRAAEIKAELLALGAYAAQMSGSGPSVFGLFKTEAAAYEACKCLTEKGITAFSAKSV